MAESNKKMVPRSVWSFPRLRPFSVFEDFEDDWDLQEFSSLSGLSVSEDESHIYVEAALPGLSPDEVDMTYEKGTLWIKGEKKEEVEDKKKKYYRKAMNHFSYRIAIPGEVDENREPEAICSNGVLRITFFKSKKGTSKKIPIKKG
ncbi:MAG TPA: Hsp20/alpha crystallin family protein [Rhabdochlamydiaceae bacterium]|nr:Hsp20/alpha crystallin family protein [Rhabdochlamydiaceae bacterium]